MGPQIESESHLVESVCDPMDYTVHGILQDRILEWIAIPFPRCRRILYQVSHQGRMFNCCTISLISYARKVMLKILQARLQQCVHCELPDVQAGFRKGRGTRDQIANTCWIIEKAREFQKNVYFCFIDYAIAFDCVGHNKLWKILKETHT